MDPFQPAGHRPSFDDCSPQHARLFTAKFNAGWIINSGGPRLASGTVWNFVAHADENSSGSRADRLRGRSMRARGKRGWGGIDEELASFFSMEKILDRWIGSI